MFKRFNLRSLLALSLAGALLAGCGGDAESPPPPVGEAPAGPDTTPPTVSIASDVSAPPATGPVTFTFVFDEDVGISFESTDIVVTGGTAGMFNRLDGRQATLVVAPIPGVGGTMTVTVPPGSVTDLANNANVDGASKSVSYMATQTITFTSPGSQLIGTPPLTLSASASSGLPVTITSMTTSVCTVSGTTLTLVTTGTCSLTATQAGDSNFMPAAPVTQTFAVTGLASQTITFTSPGNQTIGTATPALSASASSGLPVTITSTTASVCTVSGTTLTLVAAGTCSLTANQPGDSTFAPATPVTQTFAVAGGGIADAVFSTGLAGGNRTVEGGEFGGFSGSNLDGFNCTGGPAWCGSGGDTVPNVAAADSFFFYYYQTPAPATDLYMGIFVLAPGVTGGLSPTGDSPGVQVSGQTAVRFKVGQNPEWFSTNTKNFAVDLTLGKRYVVGGNTCRVQLRTIVTPTAAAATEYTVPFSAFSVAQDCAQGGLTVAQALAASPISQVTFQGVGGGIALSAGGKTSGANLSVATGGVYPTTLVLVGGISFEP
jgi:hypothetical protein